MRDIASALFDVLLLECLYLLGTCASLSVPLNLQVYFTYSAIITCVPTVLVSWRLFVCMSVYSCLN